MEVSAATVLFQPVTIPIDPANPCAVRVDPIVIDVPVRIVWILPPGYQFGASGVSGLGPPDFEDGRFEAFTRRRFGWTARRGGSNVERAYALTIEWVDAEGGLRSCVAPDLRIINRS